MTIENIQQFRQKYPQYNQISDQDVAQRLHSQYYSKIPFDQFAQRFGVQPQQSIGPVQAIATGLTYQPSKLALGAAQNVVNNPSVRDAILNEIPGLSVVGQAIKQPITNYLQNNNVSQKIDDARQQLENNFDQSAKQYPNITSLYNTSGQAATALLGPLGEGATIASNVGKGLLNKALPILKQMNNNGLINAVYGANEATPQNASHLYDGLLSYAAGALIPGVNALGNKAAEYMAAPIDIIARKIFNGIDTPETQAAKDAAMRLGINTRPAEASGDPIAAKFQARLGTSEEGARKLAEDNKQRTGQEQTAIQNFLNLVSPDSTPAAADVRTIAQGLQRNAEAPLINNTHSSVEDMLNSISPITQDVSERARFTANKIINDANDKLNNQVQPIYEAAYKQKVAPNKIKSLMNKDGTIENAINNALNDPANRFELQDYAQNSVKVLDLAKRNIDAQILQAQGTPLVKGNDDLVRKLTASKQRLVDAIDTFSPTYKAARLQYNQGAPAIAALRDSPIGKVANLDNTQLKNVGKILFDPNETNQQVLANVRDQFGNADPNLWPALIRNEFQRRLGKASTLEDETDYHTALFNSPADINQFNVATQKLPQANAKLNNIANNFTQLPTTLDQVRNTKINQLANLSDDNLKNVSRIIFDPSQTDESTLAAMRDKFEAHDPNVWRRIVRNEMERRLDSQESNGTKFYRTFLRGDRTFNQFVVATKNIPGATQKLNDMRLVFKGLLQPVTPQTDARYAANHLDDPRNVTRVIADKLKSMFGGAYDKAAIDVITNPNWDQQMARIRKIQDPRIKQQQMAILLSRVAGERFTNALNASTTPEDFKKNNP